MDSAPKVNKRNAIIKFSKLQRCTQFSKEKSIPKSYTENTLKEELILEHVIEYRKEFSLVIDPKRELFLYPPNECGKYKFICNTIRPTKVPFPELYDYEKCAKFISQFIEYEELNPPNEFPKVIPSPNNVLDWQIGDCFDMSIVLCSLLIAAGYNAYVVYGLAPRYITTKDETNLDCPDIPDDVKIIEMNFNDGEDYNIQGIIPDKVPIESKFDKEEADEKERKRKEEEDRNNIIDDDKPELERYDVWYGKRIHSWVLIKKNKRIDQDKYIEPATGRIYPTKNPPFNTVDAIFNNFNFWINKTPTKPASEVDLNLNSDIWEYVMLNRDNNEDNQDDENDENLNSGEPGAVKNNRTSEENTQEVLDMPPPWPEKLYISRHAYNNRTPLSTTTNYYKKTKVDKFAPYTQADGLVLRIFRYKDFGRLILDEIEYRYKDRADKLYRKNKFPYEHRVVDKYLPGQEYGWKRVEEKEGISRTTEFYEPNSYAYEKEIYSGLVYREEHFGSKIIHRYKSRDDRVCERKIQIDTKFDSNKILSRHCLLDNPFYDSKIVVTKMTQKYIPNPLFPIEQQHFKVIYKMIPINEIDLTYHYAKGKIIANTEVFKEEDNDNNMSNEDKEENTIKSSDEKDKLKKRLTIVKKECFSSIQKIEEEYNKCLFHMLEKNKIIAENKKVTDKQILFDKGILEEQIFDKANKSGKFNSNQEKTELTEDRGRSDRMKLFEEMKRQMMNNGEAVDPQAIKQEFIKRFKESKMHVTKILQDQLKEQVKDLNKEIDDFKNKEAPKPEDIEGHNNKINELQRKINIIYQRSHRHITKIMEELNVLMKDMDEIINK